MGGWRAERAAGRERGAAGAAGTGREEDPELNEEKMRLVADPEAMGGRFASFDAQDDSARELFDMRIGSPGRESVGSCGRGTELVVDVAENESAVREGWRLSSFCFIVDFWAYEESLRRCRSEMGRRRCGWMKGEASGGR
jgi:hypothetical protein